MTKKNANPWFRFFPSDWLGGTRGLSAPETGLYITLIAEMYDKGEPIDEDINLLARVFSSRPSRVTEWLESLVHKGKILRVEGGKLWNERVEQESLVANNKRQLAVRSAEYRWGKKEKENNGTGNANASDGGCERNANQNQNQNDSSLHSESSLSAPTVANNTGPSFLPGLEPEKPPEKPPGKKRAANGKAAPDVEAFKSEISKVLDPERVEALCAVRRKKGAVFSQRAGNLLLAALTACPSPAVAADEMVLRNWTSVKPEWLERSYGQPGRGPPTKSEFRRHQDQVQDEIDRALGRNRDEQRSDDNGKIVDLDRPNYQRTH